MNPFNNESSILGYKNVYFIVYVHSTRLPEHIHPNEIFGLFHMSHVQQELTTPKLPEGHGKKNSKFFHCFFIFNAILILNGEVTFGNTDLLPIYRPTVNYEFKKIILIMLLEWP